MFEKTMRNRFVLPACAVGLMGLLSGCHFGPVYSTPAPNYKESTVNFQDADGWKVANPQDAMLRGNWWEIFNEPELNALEETLNIDNQNIKISFENYMAARAVINEARAQYWPNITAAPTWNRSKASANSKAASTSAGSASTLWNAPIDVSWTPDLWGKIRNQVNQTKSVAQVSAADLQLEKLVEQAALANYFFEIRGQDRLQQILNDTVKSDQQALDAAQGSYDVGIGTYIAVVEAKTTLATVQSTATNVALLRNQYEHAIAMLLGKPATDFSMPVRPMIYHPPPIPTGVPSQLAERRPDVAATERQLAAANATIGIGYAAFFPNVTISAVGGFQSALLKHLFDLSSRIWSIGPSASENLFNGGLYRAQLHQYEAIYNADLANYRQTVLTAFQQVEDALSNTRIYSQEILRQQEAVKNSQEYLDLENERFKAGVDPFVNVTIAQNTALSSQVTLNSVQVQQMLATVQLIQALGGGWDRSQLPTADQVGAKTTNADYTLQK